MSESGKSPAPAVQIDGLTVRYGTKVALDSVSLRVEPGSVYALLGRNGAGKSSLIRCLLGQQQPQAGHTRLLGFDSWTHRARAMAGVGVVPEEPDAPGDMNTQEISRFLARLYRNWDGDGLRLRLERFGIDTRTPFERLSKGQKCQVMLGLALAPAPDLLVLDDPTLGLDVVAARTVFEELVGELHDRGTSVLLTSHDLHGVERIADRVGILHEGRLVIDDELETLKLRMRLIRYRRGNPASGKAEQALFNVVAADSGPLGESILVSNYDDSRFDRFIAQPGVIDPKPSSLALTEVFTAITTATSGGRS